MKLYKNNYSVAGTVCVVLIILTSTCKYIMPNAGTKILPLLAILIALAFKVKNGVIGVSYNNRAKIFTIFLLWWFIGALYSTNVSRALSLVASFALIIVLYVLLINVHFNSDLLIVASGVICSIMSLSVILELFVPDFILNIAKNFCDSSEIATMRAWLRNSWYTGIFPDRAPGAFYGVVACGVGIYLFLRNKNEKKMRVFVSAIAMTVIGLWAVLLTAKRGPLLGGLLAAFVIYLVYKRAYRKSVLNIIISVAVIVAMLCLIVPNIPAAQTVLLRFTDNDNLLSGRDTIYSSLFSYISDNFIFGVGTRSVTDLIGVGGHNIYLTIFAENGIIGISIFIAAVVAELVWTIKVARDIVTCGREAKLPIVLFSLYIQVFFLVYGMSGNPLYDNYILYFYFLAMLFADNALMEYEEEGVYSEVLHSNIPIGV